jgi:cytosine/adenosine deaminase-related metal-dependent hydrolase
VVRLEAAAVCDWRQGFMPGALLIEVEAPRKLRVLAVGRPEEVARHPASAAARLERHPDGVLIPGLVNAHAHLDLTHIGPRPFEAEKGFGGFVDLVRRERATEAQEIAASVRLGVEKSLAAGVVAVGDIAGAVRGKACTAAVEALADRGLGARSYLEFFAIGKGEAAGLAGIMQAVWEIEEGKQAGKTYPKIGLSPHATNTVSSRGYEMAAAMADSRGFAIATHVGETMAEREFIAKGTGPQRRFLEELGLWSDDMLRDIGQGRSPVAHASRALSGFRGLPSIFVHVNDCSDNDQRLLAGAKHAVAYCPHASEYFGAPAVFGPHRYQEMLDQEINVALGTDSVINQPRGELSILAEMGLLHRRDGADVAKLLKMGTEQGALALGLLPQVFEFRGGALAGVVAAAADPEIRRKHPDWHPLRWVLGAEYPKAELLYIGTDYC